MLKFISKNTISSPVSSVILTGINSTNPYLLTFNDVVSASDSKQFTIRVTASGSAKTTSDYDQTLKTMSPVAGFGNQGNTNNSSWLSSTFSSGNGTGESDNGLVYLYHFNNSSEYSFCTYEVVKVQLTPYLVGEIGGGVYTVAEAHDGIEVRYDDGTNIASGTFALYEIL